MNTLLLLLVALAPGDDVLTPPADTLTPPAAVAPANSPDVLTPPEPEPEVKPKKSSYTLCLEAVQGGKEVFLAVGVDPESGDYTAPPNLVGRDGKPVAKGRYRCFLWKGEPKWEPVAPPVKTVSAGDHTCPKCGTDQYAQSWAGAGGEHTHTCPNGACGYSWSHGGSFGYPGTRPQYSPQPVVRTGG